MYKKAIVFDLENTIFSVPSIGDVMLAPLFDLIKTNINLGEDFEKFKEQSMRRPFHEVAEEFNLGKDV